MNSLVSIEDFIKENITYRNQSLLVHDFETNDVKLRQEIDGKNVLVIGGAGTIGSSFIKAVLKFNPSKLYVVDINENGLTELVRDLRSSIGYNIPEDFKTYPINFGDAVFEKILKKEGPFQIVANFAAHKHVRSEKDAYSIEAMIENNVIKAKKLLDLLLESPPEHFFCVSTDKAANPVNVMGASKKLMEEVILSYSSHIPITTARFANVAFSNGSLLAGFVERIMKKQPFSSPLHIKRYFVSPEESGQICLLACVLGKSGEIFFPKLNPERDMQKFSDIGTRFLNYLGYEVEYCDSENDAKQKALNLSSTSNSYPVYYFETDTTGEKPFEEFFTSKEELDLDRFQSLGVITNPKRKQLSAVHLMFDQITQLFEQQEIDKRVIIALLQEFIPNFSHIEKGKHLDQKM